MTNESKQIAETTLEQLGGMRALALMTGAKDFVALASGVQFRIGGGAAGRVNRMRIVLDPSDTYDVRFYAGNGAHLRQVGETLTDVYAEDLREIFERTTGFTLTGPRIFRVAASL